VALVATWPAEAFHGETCSAEGAAPATSIGSGAYVVQGLFEASGGYEVQKFLVTAPEGGLNYFLIESTFDVDIVFCVPGALFNRHVCSSGDVALFLDGCLLCTPTGPEQSWPPGQPKLVNHMGCPFLGPGTFVLYVFNCSGAWCAYPEDVPLVAYAGVGWNDLGLGS
jgi:hypothetical protein